MAFYAYFFALAGDQGVAVFECWASRSPSPLLGNHSLCFYLCVVFWMEKIMLELSPISACWS